MHRICRVVPNELAVLLIEHTILKIHQRLTGDFAKYLMASFSDYVSIGRTKYNAIVSLHEYEGCTQNAEWSVMHTSSWVQRQRESWDIRTTCRAACYSTQNHLSRHSIRFKDSFVLPCNALFNSFFFYFRQEVSAASTVEPAMLQRYLQPIKQQLSNTSFVWNSWCQRTPSSHFLQEKAQTDNLPSKNY